jgi:hypothetical protein
MSADIFGNVDAVSCLLAKGQTVQLFYQSRSEPELVRLRKLSVYDDTHFANNRASVLLNGFFINTVLPYSEIFTLPSFEMLTLKKDGETWNLA